MGFLNEFDDKFQDTKKNLPQLHIDIFIATYIGSIRIDRCNQNSGAQLTTIQKTEYFLNRFYLQNKVYHLLRKIGFFGF